MLLLIPIKYLWVSTWIGLKQCYLWDGYIYGLSHAVVNFSMVMFLCLTGLSASTNAGLTEESF